MKLKLVFLSFCLALTTQLYAQMPALERVEPMFWWAGMQNPKLQLVVHGDKIASRDVSLDYPGVELVKVHKVENPNYLFLDLQIAPSVKAGSFPIRFTKKGSKALSYTYELKSRTQDPNRIQPVSSKDFIYLIMPDRFANGDKSNDIVKGMQEHTINRDSMYYRHGGDLQGIIDHLDYLQDLGVTTLWLNPVLENDQPLASYHGYANTENYQIDPRYGSNELYRQLGDELEKRHMKLVQDVVPNHVGSEHWTIKDMPMKSWVHQWPEFTKSSFKDQPVFDPYASETDKKRMQNGWFDTHMPDLNQDNPFVQNYITQSDIWWIEYAGVDGFRIDTYAYNDAKFMAQWGKALKEEYPGYYFFGETWVHGVPNQVYFTQGNTVNRGFDTELPGVTDFQTLWGIQAAMNEKFGWDEGVSKLYTTLAQDYQYQDPTRNVVFLDNHDLSRWYSVVGEDLNKYKSGIAWLLTTRGIPQLYYGTEILMKNFSNPDGKVREDFKGGWSSDKVNKFTDQGRTALENEAYNYVKTLANYRKNNPVLQTGKLMQYVPENGIYTYFRYNPDKTVMVVMNTGEKTETVKTDRFAERMSGFNSAVNIATGENVADIKSLTLPAKTTLVLELKK
ncbi:glycoside hydrolase family 13 protein [Pontibacter sp. 172403-2]|uniref:glycoside hydrolase family 13 protein n=1 Tax=Pontibacter rufus TaxID=2791028 RepID=UPI0018AFDB94|nr:glycoside hydrolase family 13 protein [Pontibacter sp. 172403-2]MBF9254568.1 glycoside hydrolase family 13 protein [Pontibacter sp. 172403-2]